MPELLENKFASDRQRRWYFANRGKSKGRAGGGGPLPADDAVRRDVRPPPTITDRLEQWQAEADELVLDELDEYARRYTQEGYRQINRALRQGEPIPEQWVDVAGALDRGLEAQGKFSEPVAVYRGLALGDQRGAFLAQARAAATSGEPITSVAYSSTSLNPEISTRFGELSLEIVANRGLYLSPFSGAGGEYELLLPPRSQFRVLGVKDVAYEAGGKTTTRTVVQLEQL